MPDLDERLHGVDRVPVPEQWTSIEARQSRSDQPPVRRRVAVVALALALSVATTAVAIVAFDRVGDRSTGAGPIANGLIVYTAAGPSPQGSSFDNVDLFAFDPETGTRTNLTGTPSAAEESFVWSPDGTKVVFERTNAGGQDSVEVVVADANLSDQHVIMRCTCFLEMAWSPDDGRIAVTTDRKLDGRGSVEALEVYDLASSTTKVICDSRSCGYPGQPAWSPDGSEIAFSGAGTYRLPGFLGSTGPIRIADVASGAVTTLTGSREPCNVVRDGCASDTSPAWSPGGDALAYVHEVRGGTSEATTQVMVVAPDGSDPHVLSTCVSNDQCRQGPLAWSPDGHAVAFVDRYDRPTLYLFDPTGADGESIPLPSAAGSPDEFVWSPDGRELAFLSGNSGSALFLVDVRALDVHAAGVRLPGSGGGGLAWLPSRVNPRPDLTSTASSAAVLVTIHGDGSGPLSATLEYRSSIQPPEAVSPFAYPPPHGHQPDITLRAYVPVPLGAQVQIEASVSVSVGLVAVPSSGPATGNQEILTPHEGRYVLEELAGQYALIVHADDEAGHPSEVAFLLKLFDPAGTQDHDAAQAASLMARNGECPRGRIIQYVEWESLRDGVGQTGHGGGIDQVVVVIPSAPAPAGMVQSFNCGAGPDGRLYLAGDGGVFIPRSNVPPGLRRS